MKKVINVIPTEDLELLEVKDRTSISMYVGSFTNKYKRWKITNTKAESMAEKPIKSFYTYMGTMINHGLPCPWYD